MITIKNTQFKKNYLHENKNLLATIQFYQFFFYYQFLV